MKVDRVVVKEAPVFSPETRPSAVVEEDQAADRPDVLEPARQREVLPATRHFERRTQVP